MGYLFFGLTLIASICTAQNNGSTPAQFTSDTIKIRSWIEAGSEQIAAHDFKGISLWDSALVVCENYLKSEKANSVQLAFLNESYAILLSNIANYSQQIGDINKALLYNEKSLALSEKMQNKLVMAHTLNNIAFIYDRQGDFNVAMDYYLRSSDLFSKINEPLGESAVFNNIGGTFKNRGDYKKAISYYEKSLKLRERAQDKSMIAQSYFNIASAYCLNGEVQKGIELYQKSLVLQEETGNKTGLCFVLTNLAMIYSGRKDYNQAEKYGERALLTAEEIGFPENVGGACKVLAGIYKADGKFDLALKNQERFVQMRDSIHNERNRKATIRSQLKYEYDKQAAADSVTHAKESEIKNAELKRQNAEIKAGKNQQVALFGGLFLVILFAGFMYNRFKVTQKQKAVIEHQKEIVEEQKLLVDEKQKEILDSIQYAKRIQLAQIPNEKRVEAMISKLKIK
jgi:tetratricopeptide (TPR) repeat protein